MGEENMRGREMILVEGGGMGVGGLVGGWNGGVKEMMGGIGWEIGVVNGRG